MWLVALTPAPSGASPLECHFSSHPGSYLLLFVCFGVCCQLAAPRRVAARRRAFHHAGVRSLLGTPFFDTSVVGILNRSRSPPSSRTACLAWSAWELDFKPRLSVLHFHPRVSLAARVCARTRAGPLFVYFCASVYLHTGDAQKEIFSQRIFAGLFDYAEVAENLNIICYTGVFHR